MRKHKIRHLFHLAVDFIPLILIPVFMIYSHRHDLTQSTEVDIQYKYHSNEVNSVDDLVFNNLYFVDSLEIDFGLTFYSDITFELYVYEVGNISTFYNGISIEEIYVGNYLYYDSPLFYQIATSSTSSCYGYYSNFNAYVSIEYIQPSLFSFTNLVFSINSSNSIDDVLTLLFSNDYNANPLPHYTEFNVIESVSVNDIESDIMSQFTYSLYNAVTKYFNMDEVINLGAVHTWITDNVFNGNMPIGVTIVWHLICYQFVVDLIFLIYGLFMFIIDFADKCMTSFYDKSFGGGR